MSVEDFVQWRVDALRYFFRQRFGVHWRRELQKQMGLSSRMNSVKFSEPRIGKISTLKRLEDYAVALGFNPAGKLSLLRAPPVATVDRSSESQASAAQSPTPAPGA